MSGVHATRSRLAAHATAAAVGFAGALAEPFAAGVSAKISRQIGEFLGLIDRLGELAPRPAVEVLEGVLSLTGYLAELEALEMPALVVASHDGADPGHPRAVAEAYAERLPNATLIGEEEGESPLAWQGGRLSREIAKFIN